MRICAPGGMRVGIGDQVSAGNLIGEVGNSGDLREPHLYFYAMNGPSSDGILNRGHTWR